jgi:vitamin K-dependent gamma-carboxylase
MTRAEAVSHPPSSVRDRTQVRNRVSAALARPVDGAWLATFRTLYGLAMGVGMLRFIAHGWVERLLVRPTFHFKYWGFGWVEPLPGPLMHALCYGLLALTLCITFDLRARLATLGFVLGFAYLQLTDATNYLNHCYLAGLLGLLLCAAPAGRTARVPALWLYLFRFQLAVVYTFAGLAKLNADWLVRAQPLRLWLAARSDTPVLGRLFELEWTPRVLSWAGLVFDLTVPWLLLNRRTRPYAYGLLVGFHVLTGWLFPIGMFPVIMIVATLVFFPPDWPRVLLTRVGWHHPAAMGGSATAPPSPALQALVLAYVVLQLALPMRSWVYPGDAHWHEQGMRFAWRVMVREKRGSVSYRVCSSELQRCWEVSPSQYLTARQEREMSGQPELILQLAHEIAHDFAARGLGKVSVHADAQASLNGRSSAPLIDPRVDLTVVTDGLSRASWIAAADDAPLVARNKPPQE